MHTSGEFIKFDRSETKQVKMSDSHAESPQQQDAENDIAGVSTWQLLLRV